MSLCTAPLIFAGGGNRPRVCGKPATRQLSDGSFRCSKHARGRGTPCPPHVAAPAVSVKFKSIELEMEIETNAAGDVVKSKLLKSKIVKG